VKNGGGGLIIRQEKIPASKSGLIVHVSATNERLLQIAQDTDIKKLDTENVVREFRVAEAEEFGDSGQVGPLTLADIHKCVLYAMETVHFTDDISSLPGHGACSIIAESAVLDSYRHTGLIDTFPLHDKEQLKRVYDDWKKSNLLSPPVEAIRDYFGENVALYVSFTSFYTLFLIPFALLGVLQFCLDRFLRIDFLYSNLLFALLNLIAVTVFLEMWKRRSNEHSYNWGTMGKLRTKRPRPEYRGEIKDHPITGKKEVTYPYSKTMKTMLLVSLPITFVCLVVAFFLMILSFEADRYVISYFTDPNTLLLPDDWLTQLPLYAPTVVYAVLMIIMNMKYLQLAHYLTELENRRTQEQFETHVITKLILFEFVNTFLSLFYVAFVLQDMAMLKSQIVIMLVVLQLVNQLVETILPVFMRQPSYRRIMHKVNKRIESKSEKQEPLQAEETMASTEECFHSEVPDLPYLMDDDTEKIVAQLSLEKDPYESTYDDFMALWLQFGHVFLFSGIFPLAATLALLNNLFDLRMDAVKMCKIARKPTPRAIRDIGAWYMAFSITAAISVMTNCALLAMDADVQAFAPGCSSRDWVLLFVVIEHIFLLIRISIDQVISDVPKKIKNKIDRDDFIRKNK